MVRAYFMQSSQIIRLLMRESYCQGQMLIPSIVLKVMEAIYIPPRGMGKLENIIFHTFELCLAENERYLNSLSGRRFEPL